MPDHTPPLVAVTLLAMLSLLVAVVTFGFLDSTADLKGTYWSAGGAAAGFVITYVVLYRSFRSLRMSMLGTSEVISLIELYQIAIRGELLEDLDAFLENHAHSEIIPDQNDLLSAFTGSLERCRTHVRVFNTNVGDLGQFLKEGYSDAALLIDLEHVQRIITDVNLDDRAKRAKTRSLVRQIQDRLRSQYALQLKQRAG